MGRDTIAHVSPATTSAFQSTRPRGARPNTVRTLASTSLFQSTRPRGARPGADCVGVNACKTFQSTRPRGARPQPLITLPVTMMFQSTRPRGARLCSLSQYLFNLDVSIHAPAWGATAWPLPADQVARVSIHAPAWGATAIYQASPGLAERFNPRARVGRDLMYRRRPLAIAPFQSTRPRGARLVPVFVPGCTGPVSIHAPAWGATRQSRQALPDEGGFNPRARVGRDSLIITH